MPVLCESVDTMTKAMITPDKKRLITLMYRRGHRPIDISSALNLPENLVNTYVHAMGLNTKPKRSQESMMSQLGDDYARLKNA